MRDLSDRGEQLPSPGHKPVFETKPIFFATVCLPVYVSCQHLMALLCTCLPAFKFQVACSWSSPPYRNHPNILPFSTPQKASCLYETSLFYLSQSAGFLLPNHYFQAIHLGTNNLWRENFHSWGGYSGNRTTTTTIRWHIPPTPTPLSSSYCSSGFGFYNSPVWPEKISLKARRSLCDFWGRGLWEERGKERRLTRRGKELHFSSAGG